MKKESSTAARELFRKNLNRYMDMRGVTQADIVTRLGVSSATASDWVNGTKYPRVDAMQALAELLEVDMPDLMKEHNHENGNGDTAAIRERLRRQPGMRILFDASNGATEEDLLDAARLLESFKKRREGRE